MARTETFARLDWALSTRFVWLVLGLIVALAFSAFDRHGLAVAGGNAVVHAAATLCHGHGTACPEAGADRGHAGAADRHSPMACGLALCGSGVIVAGAVALAELAVTEASSALPGGIILAGQEPEPGRRPPILS